MSDCFYELLVRRSLLVFELRWQRAQNGWCLQQMSTHIYSSLGATEHHIWGSWLLKWLLEERGRKQRVSRGVSNSCIMTVWWYVIMLCDHVHVMWSCCVIVFMSCDHVVWSRSCRVIVLYDHYLPFRIQTFCQHLRWLHCRMSLICPWTPAAIQHNNSPPPPSLSPPYLMGDTMMVVVHCKRLSLYPLECFTWESREHSTTSSSWEMRWWWWSMNKWCTHTYTHTHTHTHRW